MTYEKGQSLFEVVIALAISTIIIVTLVSLVSSSIRNSTFSRNKTLASRHAQEATEWLRGQRDTDIETFRTNVLTIIWCMKDLAWTISGPCAAGDKIPGTSFSREISFTSSSVSGKVVMEANIRVFWEDSQGDHEVTSATSFSDWRER